MASSGSTTPRISVLLPTRERHALVRTFLDSLESTTSEPERLEVIIYVDEDDPTAGLVTHPRLRLTKLTGPRVTMGAANTACLARSSGEIIVLANDDVVVRTPGWDTEIRRCHAAIEDGIYLAWPDDGFASHRISTFPILSRRVCELLVDPYPDVYRRAFIDTELYDIFLRLRHSGHDRLQYLRHVMFEHHHHRAGKRPVDRTSATHLRFSDDATFLGRAAERQRRAERLLAAIDARPLPAPGTAPVIAELPGNPVRAVRQFASAFLTDRGLPWRRRLYLFVHYCGRWTAARWRAGSAVLL